MHVNDEPSEMAYAEPLPQTNDTVETYSKSYGTWIPATVTAVVDERDVIVHYSVTGVRPGAQGFRTKRVDVFDSDLMRSIRTGKPYVWRPGGLRNDPGRIAVEAMGMGPPQDENPRGPYSGGPPPMTDPSQLGDPRIKRMPIGTGVTNYPKEGETSRRRDCHSAAPPLPLVGVSIGMNRGCRQNDSLADG